MENKMNEVAKLLGIKMGEKIYVKNNAGIIFNGNPFQLTTKGLLDCDYHISPYTLNRLLSGENEIDKEILDKVEKKYLKNFLRPFKNRIISIEKRRDLFDEWLYIEVKHHDNSNQIDGVSFPYFRKNTMYKRMELNKEYTLKDLGLFEEDNNGNLDKKSK